MKLAVVICTCFFIGSGLTQENPYADLTYDSLVIYDFEYMAWTAKSRIRIMSIIDEKGNLPNTVKKSVRLPKKQAQELTYNIGLKKSYGELPAACFDPHFGMVYYENGKAKEYITVCMSCNFPRPSLPIPGMNHDPDEFDGEVYYRRYGFSKYFRVYLNKIKKQYGFPEHKDKPPFED